MSVNANTMEVKGFKLLQHSISKNHQQPFFGESVLVCCQQYAFDLLSANWMQFKVMNPIPDFNCTESNEDDEMFGWRLISRLLRVTASGINFTF